MGTVATADSRGVDWRLELERDGLLPGQLANARLRIAAELGIAPKTASSHVEHFLAKLGASRRAEIAAWASGRTPAGVGR